MNFNVLYNVYVQWRNSQFGHVCGWRELKHYKKQE